MAKSHRRATTKSHRKKATTSHRKKATTSHRKKAAAPKAATQPREVMLNLMQVF